MDRFPDQWRKSSRSGSESNCVEVAAAAGRVAARDSKNPTGPTLVFGVPEWLAFAASLKTETLSHAR